MKRVIWWVVSSVGFAFIWGVSERYFNITTNMLIPFHVILPFLPESIFAIQIIIIIMAALVFFGLKLRRIKNKISPYICLSIILGFIIFDVCSGVYSALNPNPSPESTVSAKPPLVDEFVDIENGYGTGGGTIFEETAPLDNRNGAQSPMTFTKRDILFSAPTSDFTNHAYWDYSKVKTMDLQYDYKLSKGMIDSAYVAAFYTTNVDYFSLNDNDLDLATDSSSHIFTSFDISNSSLYIPINHAYTDSHYHSDHYFIVIKDKFNNTVVDYLHVFWIVNSSNSNLYKYDLIKDENWNNDAYLKSNDVVERAYKEFGLRISDYSAPSHYTVTQKSLEGAKKKAIEYALQDVHETLTNTQEERYLQIIEP